MSAQRRKVTFRQIVYRDSGIGSKVGSMTGCLGV